MFDENDRLCKNFNDTELQGIMEEIENLEKEFANDPSQAVMKVAENLSEEAPSLYQPGGSVNPVNFDMTVSLGEKKVGIQVNQQQEVHLSLGGFDLTITENQCNLKINDEIHFSVPLKG